MTAQLDLPTPRPLDSWTKLILAIKSSCRNSAESERGGYKGQTALPRARCWTKRMLTTFNLAVFTTWTDRGSFLGIAEEMCLRSHMQFGALPSLPVKGHSHERQRDSSPDPAHAHSHGSGC